MGDILLLRHAEAVDEDLVIRESQRYLTRAGRVQAVEIGELLRAQELPIERILVSPLMRAVQTAELVAAALRFAGVVKAMPALAPAGDAHHAADELGRSACVLAVGHEPALSAIGGLLCRGSAFHTLRRAQLALVRDGQVVWSLAPGDGAPVPAG